ncbi:MAG TPA: hypothetical protein VI759_02410 [Dehalococcoidia bacterium]|nr:hypothetical protein [Dehalococcoidia bacterium]
MDIDLTGRRILIIIAVVIFSLAAIGSWPDSLEDDLDPLPLGLAFFAGAFFID